MATMSGFRPWRISKPGCSYRWLLPEVRFEAMTRTVTSLWGKTRVETNQAARRRILPARRELCNLAHMSEWFFNYAQPARNARAELRKPPFDSALDGARRWS